MTQRVHNSMLQADAGASDRVLGVDAQGNVTPVPQGVSSAMQDAINSNALEITKVYTSAVQQTITQWAAPNWSTYPWSVPDGSSVLLLGFGGQDTDLNTEVSDVFDRMSITQHPTSLKDVIKVVWRGQKVFHTIRLTMSITAGNSQFYRVELKRASDDSVVLRKVLSRNPDEAEQTIEMVTFTYKADDPYVTDGFYLEFVNDSGIQCEIDGSYSLTIFNHYQYLTPIV